MLGLLVLALSHISCLHVNINFLESQNSSWTRSNGLISPIFAARCMADDPNCQAASIYYYNTFKAVKEVHKPESAFVVVPGSFGIAQTTTLLAIARLAGLQNVSFLSEGTLVGTSSYSKEKKEGGEELLVVRVGESDIEAIRVVVEDAAVEVGASSARVVGEADLRRSIEGNKDTLNDICETFRQELESAIQTVLHRVNRRRLKPIFSVGTYAELCNFRSIPSLAEWPDVVISQVSVEKLLSHTAEHTVPTLRKKVTAVTNDGYPPTVTEVPAATPLPFCDTIYLHTEKEFVDVSFVEDDRFVIQKVRVPGMTTDSQTPLWLRGAVAIPLHFCIDGLGIRSVGVGDDYARLALPLLMTSSVPYLPDADLLLDEAYRKLQDLFSVHITKFNEALYHNYPNDVHDTAKLSDMYSNRGLLLKGLLDRVSSLGVASAVTNNVFMNYITLTISVLRQGAIPSTERVYWACALVRAVTFRLVLPMVVYLSLWLALYTLHRRTLRIRSANLTQHRNCKPTKELETTILPTPQHNNSSSSSPPPPPPQPLPHTSNDIATPIPTPEPEPISPIIQIDNNSSYLLPTFSPAASLSPVLSLEFDSGQLQENILDIYECPEFDPPTIESPTNTMANSSSSSSMSSSASAEWVNVES